MENPKERRYTNNAARVVSCQRLRDRKFRLCKAKRKLNADAIRERFAGSSRRVPYISIHAYYIGRRASRKCIQRSRNLHPWRVRDASWSIYLAEAPLRPALCLSFFFRPEPLSSRFSRFFCSQRDMHPLIEVIPCLPIKFNGICFRASI